MACGALGFSDAGLVFLGAGVFSWLSLEPAILQRLRSAGELPTPLRTSLGSSGACAGGLQRLAQRHGGGGRYLAKLLLVTPAAAAVYAPSDALVSSSAVQCFFLELFVRHFRAGTTGLHLGQARGDGFFHHLAMPLFIFSNLVVGLLLLRTALLLVSGKLLLQVDRETLLNKKEGS
ncbi:Tellurite resistance protein TehA [Klebsiella pneumoniae]|uniref:Tellurite resistance protein TehA n=1 Tax=Klebsiella pneumoniae TaxID=573 RepID=A0A378F5H3_KLEPN|nr:Tellurite resistance protein TehA [Klebsiella pneumoniae]